MRKTFYSRVEGTQAWEHLLQTFCSVTTSKSLRCSDSWFPSQKSACNPSSLHSSITLISKYFFNIGFGLSFCLSLSHLKITHWLPNDYRIKTHLHPLAYSLLGSHPYNGNRENMAKPVGFSQHWSFSWITPQLTPQPLGAMVHVHGWIMPII